MNALNIRKQTAPVLRNLSILFYGMPKVGKTTQAAKFPGAVILNCEPGGTDLLKGEYDVIDVPNLDHLSNLLAALSSSEYKTIIIDGFTWLINQAVREQARKSNVKDRRRVYGDVTDRVSTILGELLSVGKIVIATGHSRIVDVEDDARADAPAQASQNKSDAPDKVEIRPDINPRLSDSVFGLFSIIAYCYASADGSKMLTKPVDNDKRRILAGDRSGVLPKIMKLDGNALMGELRATAVKQESATEPQP